MSIEVKTAELDIKSINEKGEFEGYASVFGVLDSHNDIVVKNAFEGVNVSNVKMLMEHTGEPVGKYTEIYEDDKGLFVKGKLYINKNIDRADMTYNLLKNGKLKSLSIGYRPLKYTIEYENKKYIRYLKSIELGEISIVSNPSNKEAIITDYKNACQITKKPYNEREFEAFLRDAGGFSRKEAKILTAKGWQTPKDLRDADVKELKKILGEIKQLFN